MTAGWPPTTSLTKPGWSMTKNLSRRGTPSRARPTRRPCGTRFCAGRRMACSLARCAFDTPPVKPLWRRKDGKKFPWRGSALRDKHGSAEGDPVVNLDHVGDRHANAAVGRRAPQRGELIGAGDPRPVVDAEPACLDRVLRARRDHL